MAKSTLSLLGLVLALLAACSMQTPTDIDLAMLEAARAGNSAEIARLIKAGASPNGAKDDRLGGALPLVESVVRGHVESTKALLSAGAEPNRKTGIGNTALVVATSMGNEPLVNILLQAGANPNVTNREGWGPLQIASRAGNVTIVRALLAKGARKEHKLPDGNTALFWAQAGGHAEVAAELKKP